MKKMIRVPVGCEPTVKKYSFGSTDDYLDYGYPRHELYPTGDIGSIIDGLVNLQKKYSGSYENMRFEAKYNCGCPGHCSCSPSYILYGDRMESDVEYNFRRKNEDLAKMRQESADRAAYEKLKKQFG